MTPVEQVPEITEPPAAVGHDLQNTAPVPLSSANGVPDARMTQGLQSDAIAASDEPSVALAVEQVAADHNNGAALDNRFDREAVSALPLAAQSESHESKPDMPVVKAETAVVKSAEGFWVRIACSFLSPQHTTDYVMRTGNVAVWIWNALLWQMKISNMTIIFF